jgi:hypothetical protein
MAQPPHQPAQEAPRDLRIDVEQAEEVVAVEA